MECNRDDAIKAKDLAKRRMEQKDFTSARRFASKAHHLYPNLEDISKIMLVCDVLCSDNQILCGKEENDWYAILKIEPTADEARIRRQYRKFVLTLHPDKNSFAGASEAFQLVNEAHRILLDRKLRMLYDLRLQAARFHSQQKANPTQYPQEQTPNEKVDPQCTNQQDQQDHQEDSCSKMAFHVEGEDNHLEITKRHVSPFNESSNTNIKASNSKSTIEGTTNFGKLNGETQKKRQQTGSISDFEGKYLIF